MGWKYNERGRIIGYTCKLKRSAMKLYQLVDAETGEYVQDQDALSQWTRENEAYERDWWIAHGSETEGKLPFEDRVFAGIRPRYIQVQTHEEIAPS